MMKTLLVINDDTAQGDHAAKLALIIARALEANILIANTCKTLKKIKIKKVCTGGEDNLEPPGGYHSEITESLIRMINRYEGFKPEINEINISGFNEIELAEFLNREQIWMIVKGMADQAGEMPLETAININILMNRVRCPLMMVPLNWPLKKIERPVYIADLRYCRIHFIEFLAELARPWNAIVSIANLSAKGLPFMSDEYASAVFKDEVCAKVKYDNLLLNNIKERDLYKALDVIINAMHNDIIVMIKHRFHFKEIIGNYITEVLPDHITVPLLIFPY